MPGDPDATLYFFSTPVGIAIATVVIIMLMILCSFFSLCGYLLSTSGLSVLKSLESDNKKSTELAVKIKNNSAEYSRAALTGFCFNAIVIVILSILTYTQPLNGLLDDLITHRNLCYAVAVMIIFLLDLILIVTLCRLVPEKSAADEPDKKLLKLSRMFRLLCALLKPIVAVCTVFTNIILRIFGHNTSKSTKNLTEEKILMMVDEGEENGSIEENTKSMIENVFDFDDTTVGEIMTHRKDVVAVRDNISVTDLAAKALESGKSRIPVYHEDIDDIKGIIYVKDLLQFVSTNAPTERISEKLLHDAVFVPESKRCSEMFKLMTSNKTQIAVIVDEYGGTCGIVTMEDLIESILGNIQDEYDNEDEEIRKVSDYSFSVDGSASLDEISELTGIDFDNEESDTAAGLMLDRMGHIPKHGEHPSIMIDGTRFTVVESDNRRIIKILIVKNHKSN